MSSLKSQLSLSPFSDRLASLLNVYSCLKSLPWNSKRKKIILSKFHGLGSLLKYQNILPPFVFHLQSLRERCFQWESSSTLWQRDQLVSHITLAKVNSAGKPCKRGPSQVQQPDIDKISQFILSYFQSFRTSSIPWKSVEIYITNNQLKVFSDNILVKFMCH